MTTHVQTDLSNGIFRVTLNRPEVRNAMSPEMTAGLLDAARLAEDNREVRCVLLVGAGDHFMAGGNPKAFLERLAQDRKGYVGGAESRVTAAHVLIRRLRRMPKPVLVSVQGSVAGFGLSLVLAADIAIASESAFFAPAYNLIGLPGDGGVSYFLPRILGERRALDILLSGHRIAASQALDWGLVTRVLPAGEWAAATEELAARLAAGPTAAQAMTKSLIRGALDRGWEDQSAMEAEMTARALMTDDHQEGLQAFVEKRAPRFSGH